MIENVDKYVNFLVDHEITTDEFLLLYLIAIEDYDNIKKYFSENPLKPQQIDKMVGNNIITIRNYNKEQKDRISLKNIVILDRFKKKLIIDKEEAAQEIWDNYFLHLFINGIKVPAKTMMFDDFVELYGKTIKNNRKEHERILNITVNYTNSRAFAEMGIEKYIGSRHYDLVEKELVSSSQNNFGEDSL